MFAALWLLGLYAAAPALRTGSRYDFADRLRDAAVLGIAIPFALGFMHALYAPVCWVVLLALVAVAYPRGAFSRGADDANAPRPPYVTIAALLLVAWPQLTRPLLDGDSLSYHLPNAAAWVQAHSLWTTATHYWWYPPASELFASALYAVAGPFALPWSGFCALMLLGFRIAAWAREAGAAPLLADTLAAATISAYPLAIQGGTLQNDVWLGAFWLETLWALRTQPQRASAARTVAATALIKPQGWLFAAIALVCARAPARLWLMAGAALGVWLLHDALLWYAGAAPAPANAGSGNLWSSTILAHGAHALALLVGVTLRISPFALLALLAALCGALLARRDRELGWSASAAAIVFFVLPFGYETSVAQLATGQSLRFASPAIAVGALILLRFGQRAPAVASALLLGSTLYGGYYVLAIFWNDGSTHVALATAAAAAAIAAAARLVRTGWPNAIAFGLGVLLATHLAARHPLDYYDDALRVNGVTPGVYRWLARTQPAAVGGWGLRLGVVNVITPATRTLDLPDEDACAQARIDRVLLVAVAQSDLPSAVNAERLQAAHACGYVRYVDQIAVVMGPRQGFATSPSRDVAPTPRIVSRRRR